jgi:hypothetical protein
MKRHTITMTPAQFSAVADTIGSRGKTREAARLILVDALRPSEAARALGLTPQAVYDATRRVRRVDAAMRAAYGRPL